MQQFITGLLDKLSEKMGNTTTYTRPTIDKQKFLDAIAANETSIVKGDPYKSSQPSGIKALGDALGKYRVTEGELKTYARRYLGQDISKKQFLASSTAQDNYVYNKAKTLSDQGYTPQQVADIHNQGFTKAGSPGSTTYQNADYVNKFNTNYTK